MLKWTGDLVPPDLRPIAAIADLPQGAAVEDNVDPALSVNVREAPVMEDGPAGQALHSG
jgi:hypothetical protein